MDDNKPSRQQRFLVFLLFCQVFSSTVVVARETNAADQNEKNPQPQVKRIVQRAFFVVGDSLSSSNAPEQKIVTPPQERDATTKSKSTNNSLTSGTAASSTVASAAALATAESFRHQSVEPVVAATSESHFQETEYSCVA